MTLIKVHDGRDPPSMKWSDLKYVIWHQVGCLEAEILTDVQQRLALLSRETDNHNGHRIFHQPTVAGG